MSKYGVFFGPYFPAVELNTERYGVNDTEYSVQMRENTNQKKLRTVFSPNAGKYGAEKAPYLDTFHAVLAVQIHDIFAPST